MAGGIGIRVWVTRQTAIARNLNREAAKIKGRTKAGVREAAHIILNRAKIYTPVRTSTLINSADIKPVDTASGPGAIIFYSATYAGIVHESPRTRQFRKPGACRKFLQRAIHEKAREALKAIADSARGR